MFKYNTVVTFYRRIDGVEKPIHACTFQIEDQKDLMAQAGIYILENFDVSGTEPIFFDCAKVEENNEVFTG